MFVLRILDQIRFQTLQVKGQGRYYLWFLCCCVIVTRPHLFRIKNHISPQQCLLTGRKLEQNQAHSGGAAPLRRAALVHT